MGVDQRVGTSAPQRTNSIAPQQRGNAQQRVNVAPHSNNCYPPGYNATPGHCSGPKRGFSIGTDGLSGSSCLSQLSRLTGQQWRYPYKRGRPYAGYYNAHGYYNSFYAPHLGFRLNVLPYGYYPFYFGPYQYFYSDGLYYQYLNNQYSVVEPPVGAAINTLPDNSQSIVINGVQYYELNGVYYQPITKDDGSVVYQVAGKDGELNTDGGSTACKWQLPPQIGDIVQLIT